LKSENQSRSLAAHQAFAADPGLAAVADTAAIERHDWSLSIPFYVAHRTAAAATAGDAAEPGSVADAWAKGKPTALPSASRWTT
jgi:hypothetical protein